MDQWQLARHLEWPRFVGLFIVADVCALVVPLWALMLRMASTVEHSPALENLRRMSDEARMHLQDLLDDAAERATRKTAASE